jgi:hypothetical protein
MTDKPNTTTCPKCNGKGLPISILVLEKYKGSSIMNNLEKTLPALLVASFNIVLLSTINIKPIYAQPRSVFIRNTLSGKCIDVAGAPGAENGTPLLIWDCNFSGRNTENGSPTDQKWTLTSDGFIRNRLSGKCIDVAGAPGTHNGAPLLIWDCNFFGRNTENGSPTDQKWTLTSDGFIRNRLSGKCIDVAGAPGIENGALLVLWDCNFSGRNAENGSPTDQKWKMQQ